jgi:hypothetical protein
MALAFEKACRGAGLSVKIEPVPRSISASCGLACSYPCGDEENVIKIAESKRIEVEDYHRLAS